MIRPIIKIQYNQLINYIHYIHKPIRKNIGGFKDKIVSLFKTNTSQQITYGREKKLSKPRKHNIKKLVISEENKEKN